MRAALALWGRASMTDRRGDGSGPHLRLEASLSAAASPRDVGTLTTEGMSGAGRRRRMRALLCDVRTERTSSRASLGVLR